MPSRKKRGKTSFAKAGPARPPRSGSCRGRKKKINIGLQYVQERVEEIERQRKRRKVLKRRRRGEKLNNIGRLTPSELRKFAKINLIRHDIIPSSKKKLGKDFSLELLNSIGTLFLGRLLRNVYETCKILCISSHIDSDLLENATLVSESHPYEKWQEIIGHYVDLKREQLNIIYGNIYVKLADILVLIKDSINKSPSNPYVENIKFVFNGRFKIEYSAEKVEYMEYCDDSPWYYIVEKQVDKDSIQFEDRKILDRTLDFYSKDPESMQKFGT